MNETKYKFFNFISHCFYFLKIVTVFTILLLLLYWIQNLTNANWGWLNFFQFLYMPFLAIGESCTDKALELWGESFEYKYMIALVLYIIVYYLLNFAIAATTATAELYGQGCAAVRRIQQNSYNYTMAKKQEQVQSKLNNYKVAIFTELKKKYLHRELNVDINVENKIMTDYIFEKLGVNPEPFENGFLYSFDDFSNVDGVLLVLFKLVNSQSSKLDYSICVQIEDEEQSIGLIDSIKLLAELNLTNKIYMLANTRYRYKFNKSHRYNISRMGIYQKEKGTVEVYEFAEQG
ncbi:MAG: hypothetical protein MJ237_03205 [bacterium]|nr:hypothetical protein [bacterium]